MGRPRIGYSRRINIEPDVINDLRVIAAMRGVPVSVVIRDGLRHYVGHVLKSRRAA
jgi:hypothetical protein